MIETPVERIGQVATTFKAPPPESCANGRAVDLRGSGYFHIKSTFLRGLAMLIGYSGLILDRIIRLFAKPAFALPSRSSPSRMQIKQFERFKCTADNAIFVELSFTNVVVHQNGELAALDHRANLDVAERVFVNF